jgi:hypothetical protein
VRPHWGNAHVLLIYRQAGYLIRGRDHNRTRRGAVIGGRLFLARDPVTPLQAVCQLYSRVRKRWLPMPVLKLSDRWMPDAIVHYHAASKGRNGYPAEFKGRRGQA